MAREEHKSEKVPRRKVRDCIFSVAWRHMISGDERDLVY